MNIRKKGASLGKAQSLLANITLDWKVQSGPNTLAYTSIPKLRL